MGSSAGEAADRARADSARFGKIVRQMGLKKE